MKLRPIVKKDNDSFKKFKLYLGYFIMVVLLGLLVYFFIKII